MEERNRIMENSNKYWPKEKRTYCFLILGCKVRKMDLNDLNEQNGMKTWHTLFKEDRNQYVFISDETFKKYHILEVYEYLIKFDYIVEKLRGQDIKLLELGLAERNLKVLIYNKWEGNKSHNI